MKHFIFVVLFFFANQIISQTLNGIIVNEQNTPIPEAHILNKKNKNSAYSNQNGEFSILDISIGDTLKISHINYKIKEVIIENFSPITITLNETIVSLEEVVIGKKLNALNVFSVIDTQIKPVDSSQDILQQVPGLIIGQHAGGGKAEQIFLRGFDIDHGTDITLNVDGLPVNMVSHTHGQG